MMYGDYDKCQVNPGESDSLNTVVLMLKIKALTQKLMNGGDLQTYDSRRSLGSLLLSKKLQTESFW